MSKIVTNPSFTHIAIYTYLACSVSKILGTCKVLSKFKVLGKILLCYLLCFKEKNAFHKEEIPLRSNVLILLLKYFVFFVRFYFEVGEIRIIDCLCDCHPCK